MNEITVTRVVTDVLEENSYVVSKNGKGFLVDPSGEADVLDGIIASLHCSIEAVLLTHGHFDHCMMAKYYREKGVPLYIHEKDANKLKTKGNLALMVGIMFPYTDVDVILKGGETLNIADIEVKVLYTPGHSSGGVCYIVPAADAMFSGDTIMKLSYGRTDFYSGDFDKLVESIKTIFNLDKNYTLYAGHGDITSLDYERRNNIIKLDAEDKF